VLSSPRGIVPAPLIHFTTLRPRAQRHQVSGVSLAAAPTENQEPADAKIGENLSLIVNLLSDHFF
jgi:hypothetical protein